jgi:hypothetical protein
MTAASLPWDRPASPAEIREFIQSILENDPEILVEDHLDRDDDDDFEELANKELDAIEHIIATPSARTDALLMYCWQSSVARLRILNWDDPRRDLLLGTTWEFVRAFFDGEFDANAARAIQ